MEGITKEWKNDKSREIRTPYCCPHLLEGVIVFLVTSVLHAPICRCSLSLCLKQTPVRDMTTILFSSVTAEAALQTSVDEVVMFQTIRLPVLIGLPFSLSTAVICSQLLFVMMYGALCVTPWQQRTYTALKNKVNYTQARSFAYVLSNKSPIDTSLCLPHLAYFHGKFSQLFQQYKALKFKHSICCCCSFINMKIKGQFWVWIYWWFDSPFLPTILPADCFYLPDIYSLMHLMK